MLFYQLSRTTPVTDGLTDRRTWRQTVDSRHNWTKDYTSSKTDELNEPKKKITLNESATCIYRIGMGERFLSAADADDEARMYHVRQKNCTVLFLQYLYQTYLYSDNFWHTYTTINLLSYPAHVTFFIKSKTGNQLKFQQHSMLAHCSYTQSSSCFVARGWMSS